jgi:hypothetical protein
MIRLARVRSWVCVVPFLLVFQANERRAAAEDPKKMVVAVDNEAVTINGKRLTLPFERDELIKILGKPNRESNLFNKLLTWDDLGIVAYQQKESTTIHGLSFALDKKSYAFWPKTMFAGTLTVDGAPLTVTSDPDEVNKAKKGKPFERDKVLPDTWAIRHENVLITLSAADRNLKSPNAKHSYLQLSVAVK